MDQDVGILADGVKVTRLEQDVLDAIKCLDAFLPHFVVLLVSPHHVFVPNRAH